MLDRTLLQALRAVLVLMLLAWGAPQARAQYSDGDARDRLLFKDGDEVRGRLVWRWDEGGKIHWRNPKGRIREYDPEDVLQLETVTERLEAWLRARSPRASIGEEWALVEAARDRGLEAIARVQAYHLLTRDPVHRQAHEFLGHEERSGSWQWRWGDEQRLLPHEKWVERGRDTGHPLTLEGEHFILRTTIELGRAVDLLFDMERVYCEFQREFRGWESLAPHEILSRRINVWVYANEQEFPPLTGAKRGYYLPGLVLAPGADTPFAGSGNDVVTYYLGQGTHPLQFFELITQALVYNCVLGESGAVWDANAWGLYRENAAIEVGFGSWFGRQFQGRPGYVSRRSFELDPTDAAIARSKSDVYALREVRKELPNLIGLNYEFFHRNNEGDRLDSQARANAFVAFLMDTSNRFQDGDREGEPMRNALMDYMRGVYRQASGASSSRFDKALGLKIEELSPQYREWLSKF